MSLLLLPDELILQVIDFLQVSYCAVPDAAPTRFHNWTDQATRHLSFVDDICRDLVCLSLCCRRLHGLANPAAYAFISPRQWTQRDVNGSKVDHHNDYVRSIYAGGQQSIAQLRSLKDLQGVTLHDMWEYSALFNWPIRDPESPYVGIIQLRCINCSLGLEALRELFAAFPRLEELWYQHGTYETLLSEPRKFWSAANFSTALKLLGETLRTLVLTREDDALLNGHRQQHPAHVDLRALRALEHLRIAEVFLFCRVQIQHHAVESLLDRLPSDVRSLAVFYDEPREVRFELSAPPGLETPLSGNSSTDSMLAWWPRWPLGLAETKANGGSFQRLESVTVLERARPQPLKYGHLDDDHDGVGPEEEADRMVEPPAAVAETYDLARIRLLVLANVGTRRLR